MNISFNLTAKWLFVKHCSWIN